MKTQFKYGETNVILIKRNIDYNYDKDTLRNKIIKFLFTSFGRFKEENNKDKKDEEIIKKKKQKILKKIIKNIYY